VSYVSDGAVAALGLAGQVVWTSILVFSFVGIGSSVVITHHLGAHDPGGADRIGVAAIAVNTWIGLFVSLAVFALAGPLLRLMALPAQLMPLAMQFLPLMGGTLFLEAQNFAMAAVLRAHAHTRDAMWVTAAQNVVNAVGIAFALFGLGGFPRLGITGVALASAFSRLVACAALWVLVHRRTRVRMKVRDYFTLPWAEVRRILHIGLPVAGESICWSLAFMFVTRLVAGMGPTSLAVQSYTLQIEMWVVTLGLSIGLGTEILIGHLVGAGAFDLAYRELLRSLRTGLLLVLGAMSVIAVFAPTLLGLFTQDAAIIAAGTLLLRMGLVLQPGRIFNIVVISSLRATGDTRFPLYVGLASMWGLWVTLAWVLGVVLGLGLPGIWIAMSVDEWFRGMMMYSRWRRRRWLKYALRSRAQARTGAPEAAVG
jgi:putative MATE family efflux protein